MVYKKEDVENSLKKKGFIENADGKHKTFFYHTAEGRSLFITHTSHGSKNIGNFLVSKMSKQLHLEKSQFEKLVECPLKKEELSEIYKLKTEEIMREKEVKYL
ncbi:hypothetical protein MmiAt1_13440 [Methanimicrococcus sp. At1]|uniref:YcfA family protein n=1 Tax=Methanimicrococcus hacksteinii TaxID=3028293 RepID=A0ABU3VS73_9EURY|nr:hypothetical protein [Methanimicrococcus sp. At1]MDV0445750.1 hypothetical protein [Methanimicrococcus sp. At1]